MRDDIHKGAPVSRPWRGVARECTNEASWREQAPKRAEVALIRGLHGEIRSKFLRSLAAKLHGDSQLESTPPVVNPHEFRLLAKSRIESLIIDHTLMALSQGASRREAHEKGFVSAIHEFKDSIRRAVEAHAAMKDPGGARILGARLRHALEKAGASLPKMLVRGRLPQRPMRQKPTPSLDIALPLKGTHGGKHAK
jgi:hypothetical protein